MGLVGFCLSPMMGAGHGRLSRDLGLRPPARPVAQADVGEPLHHRLFAVLRLRSGGAPRSMARRGPSISRPVARRRHRRRHGARRTSSISSPRSWPPAGLRPHAPSCRATAWPKSTLAITFADLDQPVAHRYRRPGPLQAVAAAPCRRAPRSSEMPDGSAASSSAAGRCPGHEVVDPQRQGAGCWASARSAIS